MSASSDESAKSSFSSHGYMGKLTCPPPSEHAISRLHPDTIRCASCSSDVAFTSQIVSKGFHGRHGRAFLVSPPNALSTSPPVSGLFPTPKVLQFSAKDKNDGDELVNIRIGDSEKRQLVTGQHTVADIWCTICDAKLGWKYVDAKESSQQYKVGKFILETRRVVMHSMWEWDDREQSTSCDSEWLSGDRVIEPAEETAGDRGDDQIIVFNSEDEDECEDIFSGTWDPIEVAERRRSRVAQRPGKSR